MNKDYQKTAAPVGISEELVVPEAVHVAMAEIGGAVKEGLLTLAVATGLQVMTTMREESVTVWATTHWSCCSASKAPTSRITASRLGRTKIPTTSVRRRSLFSRSCGLFDQI
jgi:hypothetical protein